MSAESEFWSKLESVMKHIDCALCPATNDCGPDDAAISCADILRRAHAKTQPDWVDLLSERGCPPCQGPGGDMNCKQCWAAYLKDKYSWEVME